MPTMRQMVQKLTWFFSGLTIGAVFLTWGMANDTPFFDNEDSIVIQDEVTEIDAEPAVVEDVAQDVQHLTKSENKYKEKLPKLSKKYMRDKNRRDQAVDVIKQTKSATVRAAQPKRAEVTKTQAAKSEKQKPIYAPAALIPAAALTEAQNAAIEEEEAERVEKADPAQVEAHTAISKHEKTAEALERPKSTLTPEEKRRLKEAIQRAKIEQRIQEQGLLRDSLREQLRRQSRR